MMSLDNSPKEKRSRPSLILLMLLQSQADHPLGFGDLLGSHFFGDEISGFAAYVDTIGSS